MSKEKQPDLSLYCREQAGLDAKEVADLAGIPRRTFYDWWSGRRRVVELIIKGLKFEKKEQDNRPIISILEVIQEKAEKNEPIIITDYGIHSHQVVELIKKRLPEDKRHLVQLFKVSSNSDAQENISAEASNTTTNLKGK